MYSAMKVLRTCKNLPAAHGYRFVRQIVSYKPYPNFSFGINKQIKGSKARVGIISTPHGQIETPNFIFCATKAAMKAITPQQLRETNAQVMLSNTYHLMLTPGAELIEKMGGLQKFTGWKGPMLTDSGGYQIFSMNHRSVSNDIKGSRVLSDDNSPKKFEKTLLGIDEQGATFRSYVDQSVQNLTPEKSIEIQRKLGADLIVVLDECTPFNVEKKYTADSMQRSHRWATRSLNEFNREEANPKYRGHPHVSYSYPHVSFIKHQANKHCMVLCRAGCLRNCATRAPLS
jgi:queuine tRNA-ribosyltransferase